MVTRGVNSRAAQAEQTRQRILATAQRLFGTVGYEATSTQMIADELGLTKAAVHYHFHAKADIMVALIQPGKVRLAELLAEVRAARGRRGRVELLATGLAAYLTQYRSVATAARAFADAFPGGHDGMKPLHLAMITALYGEHPTGAQRLAYGMVAALAVTLDDLTDLSDDELRTVLRDTVLRLLR